MAVNCYLPCPQPDIALGLPPPIQFIVASQ
ncbi:hypothetical protein Patl1_20634 [Pistacia atlantica]|uniref:Uncharacterized protein n=1 Tax=Pistacia atlantica TaxID=434234 RepID=A0ACC1BNQ0_9ROSI|nr:hypothetical protein Patl1_20634 [Pistacia atlantica]